MNDTTDQPEPTVQLALITPELAGKWLSANAGNRNLRKRAVDSYARDITSGNWHLTGDGVKFAPDGTLIDGQHRLSAIVQAGIGVQMYVFHGIPASAQVAMDQNITRKAGDVLGFQDYKHYSSLAAAARIAVMYEMGVLSQGNIRVSNDQIVTFVENNPDLMVSVDQALSYRTRIDAPPAVVSLTIWLLRKIDIEDAGKFLWHWSTGAGLSEGDPILALIARLREVKRSNRKVTRAEYLALIIRAWNHWRDGKSLRGSLPLRPSSGPVDIPYAR